MTVSCRPGVAGIHSSLDCFPGHEGRPDPCRSVMVFICRHLCFFLLLSCHLDDLSASVTPDPDDDVLTGANNDFLLSVSQRQPERSQRADGPPGSCPLAFSPLAASTPEARPVSSAPSESGGTSLLYRL